jgi:hypothetical protein
MSLGPVEIFLILVAELELSREWVRELQLKAVHMLKSGEFRCALRAAYSGGLRDV